VSTSYPFMTPASRSVSSITARPTWNYILCEACSRARSLPSFPTRRSSDLTVTGILPADFRLLRWADLWMPIGQYQDDLTEHENRSEEHTSELQSHLNLVCRLLLEKKNIRQAYVRMRRNVGPAAESGRC